VAWMFTAAIWMLANGHTVALWIAANAPEARYDARTARAGLLLRASTDPSAVIAATRAGAVTYFSERHSIDLLGKADPIVARMKPVGVFKPGHDRWDYRGSIDRGHPDIVADLWLPTESDFRMLAEHGFVALPNRFWVRTQSTRVNVDALLSDVDAP